MDIFKMDARRRLGGLFLVALLGGACGFAATARRAQACDCATPQWVLERQSVTSSDASVSHEATWPAQATLLTYKGYAGIQAIESSPGELHYLEAKR